MHSRLTIPRATYRLQFHRGFTLPDALAVVPYLSALGVSHVYASPLLKARPGSTHGYDTCDPTQINPEIGTEADLQSFASALHERDMGLVLDIVPNHMAAARENPWWWDVLMHGRQSRFADYFDIDWSSPTPHLRGKVLLPVLGDEYERVLERDELKVGCEDAELTVRYFDRRFPVSPESILVPGKFLEEAVAEFNSSRPAMAQFLDQQRYRLACWRRGDTQLNYRRFFTITHLAGMRVELPQVFTDTHNHLLDWHQRGLIDGWRVDHPDGLRDPLDYLSHLRKASSRAWIVVEKILEPDEALPSDWPVDGTTGYDFLARVGNLFIDPAGETPLSDFYVAFTGEPADYASLVREKKRWILQHQLVAEVERLVCLLAAIVAGRMTGGAASPDELREALIEFIARFPVYRTYAQPGKMPLSETDKTWISQALIQALRAKLQSEAEIPSPSPSSSALEPGQPARTSDEGRERVAPQPLQTGSPSSTVLTLLSDLLQLNLPGDLENEFVARFQQLTGPAMAKGVEDTAFYCYNRFVSLNEVGGDPGHFGLSVEAFHRACGQSLKQWPNTMLATATHDTKRSEDARARLALLSEIPEEWAAAVRRWSALNEKHRGHGLPDRNAEYLLYQTLVGAWPLPVERALAYMEKASCESKQHTDWTNRNAAYDEALKKFVTGVVGNDEFVADLRRFLAPLHEPGQINSMAQTLLKLTAPGVPDIYQGTELWDLSLVDPDNRRPVDFMTRGRLLAELTNLSAGQAWARREEGLPKLWLIQKTLQLRRHQAALFGSHSRYEPLEAQGRRAAHVMAFARVHDGKKLLVIAPRLPLRLGIARSDAPAGNEVWADTTLVLPNDWPETNWQNVLTGEGLVTISQHGTSVLRLAELLGHFPVALLESKES